MLTFLQVAAEKERLEQFKRDVTTQTQRLAQERNSLQTRLDASDDIMKQVDQMNRSRIAQIEREVEDAKASLALTAKQQQQMALDEQKREHDTVLEGLEGHFNEMMNLRVKAEKDALTEDMDRQMDQLQKESDRLITGLETAVGELKSEKVALSDELEKTTTKLETAEDSLYDLQQEVSWGFYMGFTVRRASIFHRFFDNISMGFQW